MKDKKFSHHLCQAEISEKNAQDLFNASKEPWFAKRIEDRHAACCEQNISDKECSSYEDSVIPENRNYALLDIALLRCCRQIYLEAYRILVSTSTFSFTNATTLLLFFLSSEPQVAAELHSAVRSLHLSMKTHAGEDESYWKRLCDIVIKYLGALQRVYIDIEQRPIWFALRGYEEPAKSPLLNTLVVLRDLPLSTVTVTVSDAHILDFKNDETNRENRWTMTQKQEWAEYVRRALLRQEELAPIAGEEH